MKLRAEGVTKNPFSNGFEARECAVHVQNGYSNGTVPSSILFPHCCSVQVLHLTSKSLYRTKSRTQLGVSAASDVWQSSDVGVEDDIVP